MKAKWYFSTLLIILTFFGIQQYQIELPNQEIVLQFVDDQVSDVDAERAIAIVREQLRIIGVKDIEVKEGTEGELRIAYYSDANVASIKRLLSKVNKLDLGYSDLGHENDNHFPEDKKSTDYDFDVYEILKDDDTDWDFEGVTIVESKLEGDRFFNHLSHSDIDRSEDEKTLVDIAFRVQDRTVKTIENWSYIIPEVRAGPFDNGTL